MPTWPHLLTGIGITALGLTLLAKVFAKPSSASSSGAGGRSFPMVPGKRYEVSAAVSPALDPSLMEGFRQGLAAGGATNIRIGSSGATTTVVYNISPLAPLTLTQGQPLAFGGFMLQIANVREL